MSAQVQIVSRGAGLSAPTAVVVDGTKRTTIEAPNASAYVMPSFVNPTMKVIIIT